MKKNNTRQKDTPSCPMNQGVVCDPKNRVCGLCSWNPEVARARLNRYCADHNVQIPQKNPAS